MADSGSLEERKERRRRGGGGAKGCGSGCGGCLLVLTVGVFLAAFSVTIGIGFSLRIPFTHANFTAAGALGDKHKITRAIPNYTEHRLGSTDDFVNHSNQLTIGPAEGAGLVVIGDQPGAPWIDFTLVAR